jgi:hypothetical protein
MTALNMAKHRNNSNFAFWKMIKEGYDNFEATHQEPKVAVCEKRYLFDAVAPENASRPLKFDARGQCSVFQLDPTIADAVLDHHRQEQVQMANYIARDIPVLPPRDGIDGGMNPVFAAKLSIDNNGQVYLVAGNTMVPGALPHRTNPPAVTSETPQPASQPLVMASVPMPQPAPQPKEGEAPPERSFSIAGLMGNLFSSTKAEAKSSAPATESEPVALRDTNTEIAAKPKRAAPVRTASAPAAPQPKPHEAAPAKPKAVANNAPAPAPRVQQARKDETPPAPALEIRTAYSAPPASNGGLLSGAQPVVPAGSFENRSAALR